MKISQLIEIMSITGRTIPCDIFDQIETEYVSDSKGEVIKIKDMDLIHFIRAFNKKKNPMSVKFIENFIEFWNQKEGKEWK
tara:strand:- start:274 stop:516 length:243 start_codon:yes stop_codon:yes gene_type:complete